MKPSENDEPTMMNHSSDTSDSDIELITLEPDIRSGRSTSIHERPCEISCEIPASAWTDDIPAKSSIDKSMESKKETLVIFRPHEDEVSSCDESDDATLVSSSGSGSEATPPQPTIESACGTLIQVRPCEESCSSTDSHEHIIESAVDDVLTRCFTVGPSEDICSSDEPDDMECSVETNEEICSSAGSDHISFSSVSDCVSEISWAAEPQPINAPPASVSKPAPFLLPDQDSWSTNTQMENLRRMKDNLANMDLILEECLMPTSHVEEEPSKSIGCFSWMTRWLPCKKGPVQVSNLLPGQAGPFGSETSASRAAFPKDMLRPVTPPIRAPRVAARLIRADETRVDETQAIKKGKISLRKRFLSWLLPKRCVRK
ncbi:hypothetical protein DPEC_G00353530 [Dallia pectoralis]|uniref:Uncharacterized protein n=1 Tax=Dallia pectoralis TaxID=75939 RepID=A0ACC2F2L2_DALPE|nr:hypothetical protein DPEC_G00353530 [Dallia pectoralis]